MSHTNESVIIYGREGSEEYEVLDLLRGGLDEIRHKQRGQLLLVKVKYGIF